MLRLLSVDAGEIINNFGSDYRKYIDYLSGNEQTKKGKISKDRIKEPIKNAVKVAKGSIAVSVRNALNIIRYRYFSYGFNDSFKSQALALSYMDNSLYEKEEDIPMKEYEKPLIRERIKELKNKLFRGK